MKGGRIILIQSGTHCEQGDIARVWQFSQNFQQSPASETRLDRDTGYIVLLSVRFLSVTLK